MIASWAVATGLVACWRPDVNEIVPTELAPKSLAETRTVLWGSGNWYDYGQIALLLLSSGEPSCEELDSRESQSDPLGTFFQDEGLLFTMIWQPYSGDTGLEAVFEGWEGLWTAGVYQSGGLTTVDTEVFHDGFISPIPADGAWLDVQSSRPPASTDGAFGNLLYTGSFSATDCGELGAWNAF